MTDTTSAVGGVSPPDLTWTDNGTPVARAFDDPYYGREDGRAETLAVFLGGNGLPERWGQQDTFTIAELGFGTGLNFLTTLAVWQDVAPPRQSLRFVSFERWPMAAADIRVALARWADLASLAEPMLAAFDFAGGDGGRLLFRDGPVELEVILGDARETLIQLGGPVDAWYLDGFSPAANPELWEAELMADVFALTRPGGTFSTYTAAGWVRRNLQVAGFEVEKVAGYGRKRERLQGRRRD